MSGSGAGGTPVNATGVYTKTGDVMHVEIHFGNVSTASMTGDFQISGLPEAPTTFARTGIIFIIGAVATTVPAIYVIQGTTVINVVAQGSVGFEAIVAGTGNYVRLNFDYKI